MQYINYRENRQRGTSDFPIELHHVTQSHPQYVMSFHWHIEYELIRILSGSFHLTVDDVDIHVVSGSTVFIPAGSVHSGIPEDCVYECIVFDINMLMNKNDVCCKIVREITEYENHLQIVYTPDDTVIHDIIWRLFDTMAEKKESYQMIVLGSLYQFFGTVFSDGRYQRLPQNTPRGHRRIVKLKQALEFIESSYTSPITLEEISGSIHMSPKYFCRFFHEMTDRTPIDYLNYYRIERACYQLLTTDNTITEIAFNSGFNDLSYFIKTFKKYKGTTPKKYCS